MFRIFIFSKITLRSFIFWPNLDIQTALHEQSVHEHACACYLNLLITEMLERSWSQTATSSWCICARITCHYFPVILYMLVYKVHAHSTWLHLLWKCIRAWLVDLSLCGFSVLSIILLSCPIHLTCKPIHTFEDSICIILQLWFIPSFLFWNISYKHTHTCIISIHVVHMHLKLLHHDMNHTYVTNIKKVSWFST